MPSHEGFVQAYNGQAAVDGDSMLIVVATLTQQTNDKQQVEPMLDERDKLPPEMGKPNTLLADNGYFSQGNVKACDDRRITPLIALGRESHHLPWKNASRRTPPNRTAMIPWWKWPTP